LGHTFFDLNNIPWLKFFSFLGFLGIMFLAGFEIDTKVIKKELHKSLVLGFASFFIPYLLVLFFSMLFNIGIQQALILATALSTTSLAMVFTILKQSDRINTPQGQIILGSAMIVDLLSMISLSLIIFKFNLYNLVFLAVLIGILIFIRKIVFSIFSRYKGNRFEMELKFFLLLLLSLGILAEAAGLHSAAMAFLIGVMFSNIEYEHRMIIDKLNTIVFSLLAPIFFFHAGSMVSVTEMKFLTVVMFIVFYWLLFLESFSEHILPSIFYTIRIKNLPDMAESCLTIA